MSPAVRQGRNVIATIGVDAYQHLPTLKNAVKDADGVAALFRDRLGFQELAPPLRNDEATADAISALVQDQLQSVLKPDDSLVLFFAGHGYVETTEVGKRKVQTGYLIPVEGRTPEDRKFSTYLKLISFLEDVARLPARHVLVILDACYSGFALGGAVHRTRGYGGAAEDLNRRLSRRIITSAMGDETALDGGPKDGHSVFTGTLIEALADHQADSSKKGWVTSSELALFLQRAVPDWTDAQGLPKQTPDFGVFELDDRGEMIISLRGEVRLREQEAEALRAGDALYELGWLTGEPKRFASVTREYREARRFARLRNQDSPPADLAEGRSLIAARDAAGAAKILTDLISRDGAKAPAEAHFLLGMALASLGVRSEAAKTLENWLAQAPDHPDAGWVRSYISWLRRGLREGRNKALLIGINRYLLQIDRDLTLRGAVNDVERLMKPALVTYFELGEEDIDLLRDEQATVAGCREAFARLRNRTSPADAVIVHYSGHSVPSAAPDAFGKNDVEHIYLVLHDTNNAPGHLADGLTADELHRLMQEIPAGRKTLILDTHPSERMIELAGREDATYALALASDTAEQTYEWQVVIDGQNVSCGLFTYALVQALAQATGRVLTYADWFKPAFELTEKYSVQQFRGRQTPLFEGLWHLHLFGGDDPYLAAQEFVQRRTWSDLTIDQLAKQVGFLRTACSVSHPQLDAAYARGLLSKAAYGRIVQLLDPRVADADTGALLTLACAQFGEGRDADALTTLNRYRTGATPEQAQALAEFLREYETPQAATRAALLVGIDRYASPVIRPPLQGAENDVLALKDVLVGRWGFRPEDVVVLTHEEATREAILAAFRRLVEFARQAPALFCFAGHGSQDADNLPTIVPTDSGLEGVRDISLEELAKLVGNVSTNLLTIFDTSHDTTKRTWNMRVQTPDPTAGAAVQPIDDATWTARGGKLRVGTVCILAQPPGQKIDGVHVLAGEAIQEQSATWGSPPQTGWRSPLSIALIDLLAKASPETTASDVANQLKRLRYGLKPAVRCEAETQRLLGRSPAGLAAMLAERMDALEVRRMLASLDEIIASRKADDDLWPEGRLAAGIALATLRNYPEARRRLEEAVGVFSGTGLPQPELAVYA
jgi:hypothetical protein